MADEHDVEPPASWATAALTRSGGHWGHPEWYEASGAEDARCHAAGLPAPLKGAQRVRPPRG